MSAAASPKELIDLGEASIHLAKAYKLFQKGGHSTNGWERVCAAIPLMADSILQLAKVQP